MLSQSVPLVRGYSFVLISRQLEQLAGTKTRYSVGSENPGQFRGTSSMSALGQKQTLEHRFSNVSSEVSASSVIAKSAEAAPTGP